MRIWLSEQRERRGMTQYALALKVGITRQMVGAIESGKSNPSVAVAKALGDILGIPWYRFFDDTQAKGDEPVVEETRATVLMPRTLAPTARVFRRGRRTLFRPRPKIATTTNVSLMTKTRRARTNDG